MSPSPEPSCNAPLTEHVFETLSPPLAGALIAASVLAYSHCYLHRNGKDAVFVFKDPLCIGEELQKRYQSGAFPLVHAKMLAEARLYLANENIRIKGEGHAKH